MRDPEMVSPENSQIYKNWCARTYNTTLASPWRAHKLPKGSFLICGDQAWAGIPPHPLGGPCTIGKLSLLAAGKDQILSWREQNMTRHQKRTTQDRDENCDDSVTSWSLSKRVLASVFLLWVAAAKALGELSRLEWWLGKQANWTSQALAELLEDEETTRQATLQNRAAIDYLLLINGHGYDEFEGLCCLNLSLHARSIYSSINEIRRQVHRLQKETEDWLGNLTKTWGISRWSSSLFRFILQIFVTILFFFRWTHLYKRNLKFLLPLLM